MNQYDEPTEKQLRVLKIITWMFLVVAPCVYLVIAFSMITTGIEARAGNELMLYLLLVVALLNVGVAAPVIVSAETRKFKAGAYQGRTPVHFFFTLSIIQMAMVEAVYIFGLVAFLVTGKFFNMLCFYPIGIAWSFVYWPRRSRYQELLEKLNRP